MRVTKTLVLARLLSQGFKLAVLGSNAQFGFDDFDNGINFSTRERPGSDI